MRAHAGLDRSFDGVIVTVVLSPDELARLDGLVRHMQVDRQQVVRRALVLLDARVRLAAKDREKATGPGVEP